MALVLKDRVKEITTTTGTGTITLGGATEGYQSFSAIGDGNTCYYAIVGESQWEVGLGTVGTNTLTRDVVLESTNSGGLVDFSTGIKDVFCTYPAEKAVVTDGTQTLTNKTLVSPVISTISNTGTLTLPTTTDTLVGRATTDTLTNKTIALGSNTLTGTKAEFDTACSDGNFLYTDYVENAYLINYTDLGALSTSITLDITKKWNIGEFTGSDTTYTINGISPTVSTLEPAHFTIVNNGSVTKTVLWDTNLFSIAGSTLSQVRLPVGYKVDFDVRRNPLNESASYEVKVGDVKYNQTASGLETSWNPSDKEASITLSNENFTAEVLVGRGGISTPLYSSVRGFGGKTSGKWRIASRIDSLMSAGSGRSAEYSLGITSQLMLLTQGAGTLNASYALNLICAGSSNTTTLRSIIENIITSKSSFVASPNKVSGVLGVLLNFNTGKGWLTYNDIVLNSGGDPEADTNPDFLIDSGITYYPCASFAEYGSVNAGIAGIHTILNKSQDIYQSIWPSFPAWTA